LRLVETVEVEAAEEPDGAEKGSCMSHATSLWFHMLD